MRAYLLITASALALLLSSCGAQEVSNVNGAATIRPLSSEVQNTPSMPIDVSSTETKGDNTYENIIKNGNPDEIAEKINNGDLDIKVLWDKFEIESDYEMFTDKSLKLNAEVIAIDLGKDNSEIKMLKVHDSSKYNGQLMFFKNIQGEWTF